MKKETQDDYIATQQEILNLAFKETYQSNPDIEEFTLVLLEKTCITFDLMIKLGLIDAAGIKSMISDFEKQGADAMVKLDLPKEQLCQIIGKLLAMAAAAQLAFGKITSRCEAKDIKSHAE